MREAVRAFASAAGASGSEVDDLVLATDELCSNVVAHAYPDAAARQQGYSVRFEASPEAIAVVVTDRGVPFDRGAAAGPGFDGWLAIGRKGGLGLPLVHALVDALEYRRESDGTNVTRLTKNLAPPAPPERAEPGGPGGGG